MRQFLVESRGNEAVFVTLLARRDDSVYHSSGVFSVDDNFDNKIKTDGGTCT